MRHALTVCLMLTLSLLLQPKYGCAQTEPDSPENSVSTEPSDETAPQADQIEPVPTSAAKSDVTSDTLSLKIPYASQPDEGVKSERLAAPDVYLLPDENGKLRKVLGFQYEDFLKAWQRSDADKLAAPPRYVIEDWNVSGNAEAARMNLTVQFKIAIQALGWVDVPIQLPELILQQAKIDEQQAGECLIYNQQQHGYVLWLKGEPGTSRTIALDGIVKLSDSGASNNLQVHMPRSLASSFVVTVPVTAARFESSPELAMETDTKQNATTEVKLIGQANPIQLRWTADLKTVADDAAPLAIEEQTVVQVSRRTLSYDAVLRVNSFGRSLDRVRVRLPRGTTLKAGTPQSDLRIRELAMSKDGDQRQAVEIRRLEASSEPWSFKLVAERTIESFGDPTESRLDGFEVLDAFQQSGTITVQVDDQLQAYFDLYGEIEQIPFDKLATTPTRRFDLGRFRYTRFPWQMVVFTKPRQRRVSVRPNYELQINAEQAHLDVEYDYQLTGAQIFSLRIDLQGWELTDVPIDSGGAIDLTRVLERHEGQLILPLVDEARQQLSVKLSLRRNIQLGDNSIPLPEPLDAFVTDGELTVDSVETLQVIPKTASMAGLSVVAPLTQSAGSNTDLESSTDERIQLRTFLPQPTFAAEISQRQLELVAAVQTNVELNEQVTRVRQSIEYRAKYKPVAQLTLTIPEELWGNESLRVILEDEELPVALRTSLDEELLLGKGEQSQDSKKQLPQVVVSLPRPMQNLIPLVFEYEVATPTLSVTSLASLLLPLAAPLDLLPSQTVAIQAASPVLVTLNQRTATDQWNVTTRVNPNDGSTRNLELTTTGGPSFLPLFAQIDTIDKQQSATLERAWIQSWIAIGSRQQRSVFRFRTPNENVSIQLPEGLDGSAVELLLNGKPSAYQQLVGSRLAIQLDGQRLQQSHTLEVRYQINEPLTDFGSIRCEAPQLECQIASAPIYWQLILPRGWQTMQAPKGLIPDYVLGWRHFRWGRQPTLSQADLEQITGATPSMAPVPLSSQYVYRAFEFPATIQVAVIRQTWVFFGCAVAAFLLGLLCLYTQLAQNGLFWLGLSLVFLLGIFSYPEISLFAIEVVLIGGLMTFVARVLKRAFSISVASNSEVSAIQVGPSEATEPWQQRQGSGLATSETTATLKTGGPTS